MFLETPYNEAVEHWEKLKKWANSPCCEKVGDLKGVRRGYCIHRQEAAQRAFDVSKMLSKRYKELSVKELSFVECERRHNPMPDGYISLGSLQVPIKKPATQEVHAAQIGPGLSKETDSVSASEVGKEKATDEKSGQGGAKGTVKRPRGRPPKSDGEDTSVKRRKKSKSDGDSESGKDKSKGKANAPKTGNTGKRGKKANSAKPNQKKSENTENPDVGGGDGQASGSNQANAVEKSLKLPTNVESAPGEAGQMTVPTLAEQLGITNEASDWISCDTPANSHYDEPKNPISRTEPQQPKYATKEKKDIKKAALNACELSGRN